MNLTVDLGFASPLASVESFESLLERVIEELEKVDVEADVTASLAKYEASFELTLQSTDFDSVNAALVKLRTALHAADCGTPEWELCMRGVVTEASRLVPC